MSLSSSSSSDTKESVLCQTGQEGTKLRHKKPVHEGREWGPKARAVLFDNLSWVYWIDIFWLFAINPKKCTYSELGRVTGLYCAKPAISKLCDSDSIHE